MPTRALTTHPARADRVLPAVRRATQVVALACAAVVLFVAVAGATFTSIFLYETYSVPARWEMAETSTHDDGAARVAVAIVAPPLSK